MLSNARKKHNAARGFVWQFTCPVRAGLSKKVTAEQRLDGSEGLAVWYLQKHQCPKCQQVGGILRASGGGEGKCKNGRVALWRALPL